MLTVLDAQTADALAGFEKLSSVTMIIDGVSQTTTSQDNGAWICGDYSFSIDDNDSSNLVVKLA